MSKLKLLVGIAICGALFGGCGFFTEWGEDVKNIWTKPSEAETTATATATKIEDCVPSDLKERVAKYVEQYKK